MLFRSGEAELFRLGSASTLRLAHATVLTKAKRLGLVAYQNSAWSILNSIFHADAPTSYFAAGDGSPQAGAVSANCLWGFSTYLSGDDRSGSITELNRYSILGHPNFIESPATTFSSVNKGLPILSSTSGCVGTGVTLPWVLPSGLRLNLRASNLRDIGVDGLREDRL